MQKLSAWILMLVLMAGCGHPLAGATPASVKTQIVGQLLNVVGRVEIQRAQEPLLKGTLLFLLQVGDRLTVREGGSAEMVLSQNGARFALPEGSSVRVAPTKVTRISGPAPQPLARLSKD